MIFASDGLWNVIDPDFSVDSVFNTERQNDHNAKLGFNNWRNPSRILVETALEKWRSNFMRADNTSVVCVMLDPPNKRNMFKFCRTPMNEYETTIEEQEGARTIFDYSTSEAYNLDFAGSDTYRNDNLGRQNATNNLFSDSQGKFYEQLNSRNYQYSATHETCPSGYNSYETSYQMPSTSAQQQQLLPVTYQTSNNESAFVKACCRNNYTLASVTDQIPYHSSYEQHRQMYENMALRPYPPLHYAYRPVPTVPNQIPLPSLHANVYDHQGYLQNSQNYQPMKRYNYLRPTPEEVAALHNEEDDDDDDDSDTVEFSDEESDDEETKDGSTSAMDIESEKSSNDDSIQIFEISSSNFNEMDKNMNEDNDNSNDEAEKPAKSNNKENTESSSRNKKKAVATTSGSGRFYATRQTDRKMRSGNVSSTMRSIGKEKLARKITKNIKKVVKTLIDNKATSSSLKISPDATRGTKKIQTRTNESKVADKETQKRVLRSAPMKEAEPSSAAVKKVNDKSKIVRSFRSKQNSSNVMMKPATRNRSSALLDNVERVRDRRLK